MSISRRHLHELIDIVDEKEFGVVYHLLAKFVGEDEATPDEIEAIKTAKAEFERGETVKHEDIDWD